MFSIRNKQGTLNYADVLRLYTTRSAHGALLYFNKNGK